MDALEALVGETLDEHASCAPPVDVLRVPRNAVTDRRWLSAGLAAAAVAGVALISTAVLRSADHPVHPHRTVAENQPNQTKPISFHGITIDVPTSLRVGAFPCNVQPAPNVVKVGDPTAVYNCPNMSLPMKVQPVGGVEVSLRPLAKPDRNGPTNVLLDGQRGNLHYVHARDRYTGITGGLTLADPGVEVNVTAPTRPEVDKIIRSVRITPVDDLGCRAHIASLVPSGATPAASLVPGHPVSAVACAYAPDAGASSASDSVARDIWLYDSGSLSRLDMIEAQRDLDGPSTTTPQPDFGSEPGSTSATWLVFKYSDGSTRSVALANHEDPAVATDGRRWGTAGDLLDSGVLPTVR